MQRDTEHPDAWRTLVGLDDGRLLSWLDRHDVGSGPIEDAALLTGGTQNILLRFRRGESNCVLRRPPPAKRPNSDDTMRREMRVLAALAGTEVPHPTLLAAEPDADLFGAAFFVMHAVDGLNPATGLTGSYADDATWRRALGLAMADGAAAIGRVDVDAAGLSDLGRADGFLARQVERWRRQLDSYSALDGYGTPAIDGLDDVAAWLSAEQPAVWQPGLIHGDFHLANVIAAPDRPGLAAIVDWELCTIGDPLLDLGWLLATWPSDVPATGQPHPPGRVGALPWDGFPSESDLVDRYADQTSRSLDHLDWYVVLACYKLGIILEGTYARAVSGAADMATGERLHASCIELFRQAGERIGR